MNGFIGLPLPFRLATVAILGACAGAVANWAIYTFAWRRRAISPWSPPPDMAPARRALDRVPVVGWLTLRREAALHGPAFWVRPLIIEVLLAVGLMLLYVWEIELRAPHVAQLEPILGRGLALAIPFDAGELHAMFLVHALLVVLMTVATFIDVDDWIIPDAVTVVGTLVGLVLVAAMPYVLLPQIEPYPIPPLGGQAVILPGGGPLLVNGQTVYEVPVLLSAPRDWPVGLAGGKWPSLVLGVGCFWLWCFALVPRIWRGRRGRWCAMRLIAARVVRELRRPLMLVIEVIGTAAIVLVWRAGGISWAALLSALVGLIAGGGIVWVVRLIGGVALRREAMGFGDVTLMMMIGTYLGWQASLFIFFLAPIAGLVVGLLRLVLFRDHELPYGPFLCLAALAVMVHWGGIWNWARPIFAVPGLVPAALGICVPVMFVLLYLMRRVFHHDDENEVK